MFEQAARMKLRFDTPRGALSAEDLWDLPLTSTRGPSLNDIAIGLHHALKHDTVSFVDDERPDPRLQLGFDIVKHVIDVRKEENRIAAEARAKAEQKQKILGILARKEDAELEGKSMDELRALIGAM
jgi:hypothetical protein